MGLEVLPFQGDGGGRGTAETHVGKSMWKHGWQGFKQPLLGSVEISHVGQGLKRDGTTEKQIWARPWVFINGGGRRPHSDRGKEPFKVTGKEDGNLSMRDP